VAKVVDVVGLYHNPQSAGKGGGALRGRKERYAPKQRGPTGGPLLVSRGADVGVDLADRDEVAPG
jgi:hypothetical protein